MTELRPRVLCVDDEPAVVEGLERVLLDEFDVRGETTPEVALGLLSKEGPFDVVVSDMRMPQMNGAAFLAAAAVQVPDTIRILLTGQADVDSAIAAVNDGRVFRFLRKPCKRSELVGVLHAAVRQRELVLSERKLLEDTLHGAVRALMDVLELVAPQVFARSAGLTHAAKHVIARRKLEPQWAFEIAAMLCDVGFVTMPELAMAPNLPRGSTARAKVLGEVAEAGHKILAHIPRLERVAEMIRHQADGALQRSDLAEDVAMGAALLRIVRRVEEGCHEGLGLAEARALARGSAHGVETWLLDALSDYSPPGFGSEPRRIMLDELQIGMVIEEDVFTTTGAVLVGKGTDVTMVLRERLFRFSDGLGVRQPFTIRCAS